MSLTQTSKSDHTIPMFNEIASMPYAQKNKALTMLRLLLDVLQSHEVWYPCKLPMMGAHNCLSLSGTIPLTYLPTPTLLT